MSHIDAHDNCATAASATLARVTENHHRHNYIREEDLMDVSKVETKGRNIRQKLTWNVLFILKLKKKKPRINPESSFIDFSTHTTPVTIAVSNPRVADGLQTHRAGGRCVSKPYMPSGRRNSNSSSQRPLIPHRHNPSTTTTLHGSPGETRAERKQRVHRSRSFAGFSAVTDPVFVAEMKALNADMAELDEATRETMITHRIIDKRLIEKTGGMQELMPYDTVRNNVVRRR